MPNIFQHAIGLASFAYTMTLLVSYMILMACTLAVCNILSTVLSDAPVASLVRVENAILDKYVLQLGEPRRPVHSIASQTSDDTLAIYGVWETRDECGLVYK